MNKLCKNLKRFELVTFDVTDTLLKFSLPPAVQYAKTAASFGYTNLDQEKLNVCFSKEFKKMYKLHPNYGSKYGKEYWYQWWHQLVCNIFTSVTDNKNKIPPEDLDKIAKKLIHQYRTPECYKKIKGADDLIKNISATGKKVGVISNFDPSLHKVVKEMKLPKLDFILTSYECGYMKPDKRIFDEALKLSGINRNSKDSLALHIGNIFDLDYIGAINAGWSCLLVSEENNFLSYNNCVNKNHIYKNLQSLLADLENADILW